MAIKANYEFLFVGKDDNSFLETYYYDLFEEKGEQSGQLFITLEVQNNPVDAEEIGSAIFETMQKEFFEDLERDPYDRFETALKSVNAVLNQFREQKTSGYIGNLNVVVTAIVDGKMYLTQTGDSEMYLIRKRYVSVVSDGLNDESNNDIFNNIASGEIEEGDAVLIASARLLRYVSKTDLAKCTSKLDVAEVLESVKDAISTEMLGRVALTGIVFGAAAATEIREMVEGETTSILAEDEEGNVKMERETVSMAGKFFTALKGLKKGKSEVFQGEGTSMWSDVSSFVGRFFRGIFSKGFSRDKILASLVIVIIVLFSGIWMAKSNLQAREELKKLDDTLVSVQEMLAEAETKSAYDKDAAKEILDKAYTDTITVYNSGYYRDKAILKLGDIDMMRDKLDNVIRIADPKVVLDLSSKRADVNALGFAEVSNRTFAFEYNALYELVLDQIQDPLTIDNEETVIAATGFDDRGSIVFLTESGKLIEYKDGTMSFMDTDDGQFRKAVAVEDWSNRVYLLDPAGNQIWRYTYKGTREKFGEAEAYLSGEDLDLSNAQDIAIDSSVYVLMKNGDVKKFYGGTETEFYINDAPFNAFKNPTKIYTNEKLDEVYILDSEDARVLVFRKDSQTGNINYTTQYLLDGAGDLRDLYVDPDNKKLYVISESKVFEVDM